MRPRRALPHKVQQFVEWPKSSEISWQVLWMLTLRKSRVPRAGCSSSSVTDLPASRFMSSCVHTDQPAPGTRPPHTHACSRHSGTVNTSHGYVLKHLCGTTVHPSFIRNPILITSQHFSFPLLSLKFLMHAWIESRYHRLLPHQLG